jgi:glycosyltransferase involved in cell wall biosynthesis
MKRKNKMINITIFTPTYNRSELLTRCYESLLAQTNTNFIWLVVDDGSTDNTRELVSKWQKDNLIKIVYIYKQNGGKHTAHNAAVQNCTTPYFLILDSDDTLDSNCTEALSVYLDVVDMDDSLSGIIGNRFDMYSKKVIGSFMPREIKRASGIELYQKYSFTGDTLRLYKTSILKKFPFPLIYGEKFIYENVVFDPIDSQFKMLVIRDRLYYCEYQEVGYSADATRLKVGSPIGYAMSLESSAFHAVSLRKKINWSILYIIWSKKMPIPKAFDQFRLKYMYCILTPLSLIMTFFKQPKFFFDIIKSAEELR